MKKKFFYAALCFLIVLGNIVVHGAVKSPTFVEMSQEPLKGQSQLQLKQSVSGWNAGDRVVIPDTRQYLDSFRQSTPISRNSLAF